EFRVQVQALARFYRHFFLAFAWHNVAPWPSVYASHTKVRIGSDSAKEHEKPADTFPRDRPKAVPKRPNNKTTDEGRTAGEAVYLIRI
ncbi:hypothetical protein QZM03_14200, partial [Burkholderia multivorans]|nr:hypothetical protein [Burkholderia multivorans]